MEGTRFQIEFVNTDEGIMIFPSAILTETFGARAVATIVRRLGGTARQNTAAKVLLANFLDFAADPNSRATLWKELSWNDFTSNDRMAKLRGVGIAISHTKLKRGSVKKITMRQFNTLPTELMIELNSKTKIDIEAFARNAHNLFEQEGEYYEHVDVEMVTPNAHGSSSKGSESSSSSSSSSAPPHSPAFQSSSKRKRHSKKKSSTSFALVPNKMSFQQAMDYVRNRLLPSLQANEKLVEYATRRAMTLCQTPEAFYDWVDQEDEKMRKQVEYENENARKQAEYENENARKQAAFENEEARKKELHEIEKRKATMNEDSDESSEDEHDTEPNPLMSMRMKHLLNVTLSEAGSFAIKCPTPDCDCKISPFRYCVSGPDLENLRLCCIDCAGSSGEAFRKKFEMPAKRAEVYLYHAGPNINITCALCEMKTAPINIITSDWEKAHKVSDKLLGKEHVTNLFPAHPTCNTEQHMRSLWEVRKSSGFSFKPFPNGFRSLEKAKQARHRILS